MKKRSRQYHLISYTIVFLLLPVLLFALQGNDFAKENHSPRPAFIENKGQIIDQNNKPNPSVLYLLNTPGMNVQL